jgi:thiol-disulfide isomerase/thioredoxin
MRLVVGTLVVLVTVWWLAEAGARAVRSDEVPARAAAAGREATSDAVESTPVPIGSRVSGAAFKDTWYLTRSLDDLGERRAYVLVFTTLDCPLVARYLPVLAALEREYRQQQVQFVAVNAGPEDDLIEIARQAVECDAGFPFVKDHEGSLARAVGARYTPQVVVLDAQRRIRYRGRIDNQYRLGGVRPGATRHDLREALDELLAGREVSVPETPVEGCRISPPLRRPLRRDVTYDEVAPILAHRCQGCHGARPDAAPFSLAGYRDAAAHAAALAEAVADRRMPPWFASRKYGTFVNERRLRDEERELLLDWVALGCPPGEAHPADPAPADVSEPPGTPADVPQPPGTPADAAPSTATGGNAKADLDGGWRIGVPDLVLTMPRPFELPASGYVPYQYVILPHLFLHETWVQRVEIRPGNRAAVHHCNLAALSPTADYDKARFMTGYVPGGGPMVMQGGVGIKIPAGSVLILQIHYVATGQAASDQTSVGLVFARETIDKELRHFRCVNHRLEIPPHDPWYRAEASQTFADDATGIGLFVHMHVRGREMTFRATYPDGRQETLLMVPNYDFNWQLGYRWPDGKYRFPRGTRIDCVAHYDNSAFNPYNPDPAATVREGQQTYEEMMYGFVFYTLDEEKLGLRIDPRTGRPIEAAPERPDASPQAGNR